MPGPSWCGSGFNNVGADSIIKTVSTKSFGRDWRISMSERPISRRELFRSGRDVGSLLAASALLGGKAELGLSAATHAEPGLRAGPDVYQSIGVRPLINARGTNTIISA